MKLKRIRDTPESSLDDILGGQPNVAPRLGGWVSLGAASTLWLTGQALHHNYIEPLLSTVSDVLSNKDTDPSNTCEVEPKQKPDARYNLPGSKTGVVVYRLGELAFVRMESSPKCSGDERLMDLSYIDPMTRQETRIDGGYYGYRTDCAAIRIGERATFLAEAGKPGAADSGLVVSSIILEVFNNSHDVKILPVEESSGGFDVSQPAS